jgi:hypothetical protein
MVPRRYRSKHFCFFADRGGNNGSTFLTVHAEIPGADPAKDTDILPPSCQVSEDPKAVVVLGREATW